MLLSQYRCRLSSLSFFVDHKTQHFLDPTFLNVQEKCGYLSGILWLKFYGVIAQLRRA